MTDDLDAIAAELDRLDAAATPGPWAVSTYNWDDVRRPMRDGDVVVYGPDCETHPVADCSCNHTCRFGSETEANAALLALMRTHLRPLLAERRRMKAEIERLRTAGREYRCVNGHDLLILRG